MGDRHISVGIYTKGIFHRNGYYISIGTSPARFFIGTLAEAMTSALDYFNCKAENVRWLR